MERGSSQHSPTGLDLDGTLGSSSAEIISPARARWKLLAKALQQEMKSSRIVSTTSRELYGLFHWRLLANSSSSSSVEDGQWVQCHSSSPHFTLNIRFVVNRFSIQELTGFNNTGNVCIWPSEEVLAHYVSKRPELFAHKKVLELGGGMTCLAGLVIAATSSAALVHLTDGNAASVENVQRILRRNAGRLPCPVTAEVLDWKCSFSLEPIWDVILCADCLFFDDGRSALVETMLRALSSGTENALVLVMAPRRGGTLEDFLALCRGKFDVNLREEFDQDVTSSHKQKLLRRNGNNNGKLHRYNPDHNYPLLIQLRKTL